MNDWIYPMSPEDVSKASENVVERVAEHVKEIEDYYFEMMPGLSKAPPAQRFMHYRSQPQEYWNALAATNAARAKVVLYDYLNLWRKYVRDAA